jgi:hypothetical protein
MKIVYITHGTHWYASIESIVEALKERGHEVIECVPQVRNKERISNDIDKVLLTSNEDIPIVDWNKIVFIPHGIGDEHWNPIMDNYHKVLLAGRRPYTPGVHSKIVGWAKTDALFNPDKEKTEYVNSLMSNLPYEDSVLCIPYPDDLGDKLRFLVDYFGATRTNVIAPYQEFHDNAQSYYRNYKNIVLPKILNLYYFVPHIKAVVCSGFTSIGREFYITQIPTIHIGKGFEESINLSAPDKTFDSIFSTVWNDPKLYLQPDYITKQFIEINDGKVVERIVKEIENPIGL